MKKKKVALVYGITKNYVDILANVLIGLNKNSKYKLPFVRYDDLKKEVDDRIEIIDNDKLKFSQDEIGLLGSPTKVVKTYVKEMQKKKIIME